MRNRSTLHVRLRGTIWRLRWVVAASCLAVAAVLIVLEIRPPRPPTTPVLVAATDLSAGTVLSADHLRTRQDPDPADHRPSAEELIGERLTVGIPAGIPLTTTMVAGPGIADSAPPGTVVVPVHLADATILQIAREGDYLDLYLTPADAGGQLTDAELITSGALILALPQAHEQSPMFPGAHSVASDTDTVVVAVNADDATVLTGASGFAPFRAVLVTQSAP